MKKSLLALAVFGAFAGAAQAQSSVTMFGIVDAAVGRVAGTGNGSVTGMSTSGINSSRWGVRGTEDLGGGLKGGFWLEAGLNNDTGTTNAAFFNRRSTVSLMGGFGEVRLGRDYTPTFWNYTVFDPFGTNGVAGWNTVGLNNNTRNAVRADNTIGYLLPNLGGVYGQVMYGFGDEVNSTANSKTNSYTGARLGYANGPLDVALAFGSSKGAPFVPPATKVDVKVTNFGASYDLGVVKLMGVYAQNKTGSLAAGKTKSWLVGATAPVGPGSVKFAYSKADRDGSTTDFNQIGLGYQYDLSKRTATYFNYARLKNGSAGIFALSAQGNLAAPAPTAGGTSSGFEFGMRHSF